MKYICYFCFIGIALTAIQVKAADALQASIQVHGQGEVKAIPDIAYLNLEVWSREKDAKRAQENNAKEFSRVMDILKDKFKIDAKDIQTIQISLSPDYLFEANGKRTLRAYGANHSVQVSIREIPKLGNILDSVIEDGSEKLGTTIQGINFSTEKRAQYEKEALAQAVTNAREKAEVIAKASGHAVKDLLRIADTGVASDYMPVRPMLGMSAMADAAPMARDTQVSPGQIKITGQVLAEFGF